MLCHIKNIRAVVRHSTDHFSGLGKAIGSLCVCVCPSNTETFAYLVLTLPRSSSKVEFIGQSSRLQAKITATTIVGIK